MAIPDLYRLIQPGGPTDQELGVEAPMLQPDIPDLAPQGGFESFLSSLAGIQPLQNAQQHTFGQGLMSGLTSGLGAAGQRAQAQRARLEQIQQIAQQQRNQENLRATSDYRAARARALEGKTNFDRTQAAKFTPATDKMLKDNPGLGRTYAVGDNIPNDVLESYAKYREPKSASEAPDRTLVEVKNPDGTITFVPRPQMAGKTIPAPPLPTKPPSEGERDKLGIDLDMLSQVGDIMANYKKGLVGPFAGARGAVSQATGIGANDQESAFRAAVAGLENVLLRARSGGAVTPSEAERLKNELPDSHTPSQAFESKLKLFERHFRRIAETRRKTLSASGIDVSGLPDLPTSPFAPPAGSAESRSKESTPTFSNDDEKLYGEVVGGK